MVEPRGTLGALALVPPRSANCVAAGAAIAPRSTQCHCVVLLLDDGPMLKLERAPGLAPGKNGFAVRRFDYFSIARI